MRKKTARQKLIAKMDKLWSLKVREVGTCEKCGTDKNLQGAHLISRVVKVTRWNLENGLCLCYGCHLHWAHRNPFEFVEWVNEMWPGRYKKLRKLADQNVGVVDLEAELTKLTKHDKVN